MKLKTSKTARKRIARLTTTGKLLRRRMSAQHLARHKSRRVKKMAKRKTRVSTADFEKFRRLIPYGEH